MPQITRNDGQDLLEYRESSGGTIEIYELVVNSGRRQGVGRSMIAELRTLVKTHLIFALTREGNAIARQFYRAVGFREVATLRNFYDNGMGGRDNAVMYAFDL